MWCNAPMIMIRTILNPKIPPHHRRRAIIVSGAVVVFIIMTMNSSSVAPSPASSTSSSAAGAGGTVVNASRLRENQRRSRARKKEYLLSLEARFQACQRTGIEANVDIQIAAKRVVRENLILRGMLKMRGVTDGEIEKTLKDGGEACVNAETAVEGVLKVLGKRPCSGGGPTVGGTAMQCKLTGAPSLPRTTATERRNSTGMVAARDTDRGVGRGAGTGPPSLAVTTSRVCFLLYYIIFYFPSSAWVFKTLLWSVFQLDVCCG